MTTQRKRQARKKLLELTTDGKPVSTTEINRHTITETTANTMRSLESDGDAILCEKHHFRLPIDKDTKKRIADTRNHNGEIIWVDAVSYSWLPTDKCRKRRNN